jgi:hypothetical protein
VNLYDTTSCGDSLVAGSPFVPSPAPVTVNGNLVSPEFAFTDPRHEHAYALYNPGVETTATPPQLWSFTLTPSGLQQLAVTAFPYPGFGNPKYQNDGVYLVGATAHIVYLVNQNSDPLPNYQLTVYAVDDGYFSTRTVVEFETATEPPLNYGPTSVRVDGSEGFVYACFQQTTPAPSVWVYHVKAGVPTFDFISSDPGYIASVCN